MAGIATDQFWIRSGASGETSGPFEYDSVVALARNQRLMPYDRIALAADGPWHSRATIEDLAAAMRDGKAANRTVLVLVPHLACLASIALLGFAASRLSADALDAARFTVALCAFAIAAYDDPVPSAPPWLFALIGVVFLIPMRIPLNRGGWLVMDWLAACATILHARAIVQRIGRPSLLVKAADQIFNLSTVVLFLTLFTILRCEGSGGDFD